MLRAHAMTNTLPPGRSLRGWRLRWSLLRCGPLLALLCGAAAAYGQSVAIVGGDIHTVTGGVIRRGTVLIENGKIKALGQRVEIPEGVDRLDARGKVVTPGFVSITTAPIGLRPTGSDASQRLADSLDAFDSNIKLALSVGITSGCVQLGGGGARGGRRRDPADGSGELVVEAVSDDYFVGLDSGSGVGRAGLSGDEDQSQLDYGDASAVCPCCGLTYLQLEPIDETPEPSRPSQRHVVVKMSHGSLDGMLVAESVFYDASPSLLSPLNRHQWRQQIAQAKRYLRELEEFESRAASAAQAGASAAAAGRAGGAARPDSGRAGSARPAAGGGERPRSPVSPDVLRLVKGEIPMRVAAESRSQIQDLVLLADELGYRLVIERGTESWLIPQLLSEHGVAVIMTPRLRRIGRGGLEDLSGSFVEMPRILQDAGVPFAVAALSGGISLGGIAGRDLTSLPLEAIFAIRGGASDAKALESLTIVPARMMGLEQRLGSLEVGKDGDVLILDGPPLDYQTYVSTAIVNGRVVYQRELDRLWPVFER
jgi:hypothetical protein